MADDILEATSRLRDYLWDNVYYNHKTNNEFVKSLKLIKELYEYFVQTPEAMQQDSDKDKDEKIEQAIKKEGIERIVCDFIAGMTDPYALRIYQKIFYPQPWLVI